MNIQDAKQEIIHTILAYTAKNAWGEYAIPALRQRPLLLIGPPGIGKTAVMEQAARACGVGFVSYTMTHHTRQSAVGLPFIERKQYQGQEFAVTEYTMSEIIASVFDCIENSGCKEGLLFLDEINCVSETLAPAMLQFLQNKVFGSHRLPDGWVLAAAGNPPEYNKSVREFDIATLDRLKYIEVKADYEVWRSYALEMNIHGAILAYLDTHPEYFYILKQDYKSRSFVTARGWEDLSCLLLQYEALNLPVNADLMKQYLHADDLANDFSGYYHLYLTRKKTLPVSAMMSGDTDAVSACKTLLLEGSFDEKLHLVHLMLSLLNHRIQTWTSIQEQLSQTTVLLERLSVYQKQNHLSTPLSAVNGFLKKEKEILAVRREHGLSSEQELRQMQQSLFRLQELTYQYREQADSLHFFENCLSSERDNQTQEAERLLASLQICTALLAEGDGAEFTMYLSSIKQNSVVQRFLQKYPSSLLKQYQEKLNFQKREDLLKKQLEALR